MADAFGVTAAAVRSWEAGRCAPRDLRRAACAAFLSGLAHGLVPSPADTEAKPSTNRPDPVPRAGVASLRRPRSAAFRPLSGRQEGG
ncbi:hypothetical protein ACKI1J_12555 [Streptomyces scabiei]|uniref:hypothetical protein n=1 Tax=Streptomyces scabiei TaxID=1930 RepID=UPI0038F68318